VELTKQKEAHSSLALKHRRIIVGFACLCFVAIFLHLAINFKLEFLAEEM